LAIRDPKIEAKGNRMVDDLIAIAALADIMLTAFLVIWFRRKPFPYLHFLLGLAICALILSMFTPAFITPGRGAPVNLMVITSLCFSISCSVPLSRPAWSVALLIFTLAMLVTLPVLANTQQDYTFFSQVHTRQRDSLYDYLEKIPHQERSFPAGWLAGQPFASEIPPSSMQGRIFIPHPLWHSRFSGIYEREIIYGEAWYPGGPLKDGRRKIEIRER